MIKKSEIAKVYIATPLLLFLFMPILQSVFTLKNYIRPLKGAYTVAADASFSVNAWLNGSYQEAKEKFLDQNFGFRNYYVMLNNQLDYKLFNKANVDKVVVGKGGFLYETEYINAYFGNNFVGTDKLREKFTKLKDVQDILFTEGIDLEVVFCPGKASFYPEFIPENWVSQKKISNYDCAKIICKKLNINHVDFNAWFLDQKNISPYDLYPKTGIHWSNYGSLIAMDSLKKHIEKNTGLNLRDLTITNISFSDSLISPDKDIGNSMNLFWEVAPLPMPYAHYTWVEDSTAVRPKALFIGDSYFWNIYYEGLTNNLFTDCKFWYYDQTVYPESEPEREVKKLNLLEEIKKQRVIVLMATESNIQDIGWDFIEQVHSAYKTKTKNALRRKIYSQNIAERIRKTPEWLQSIQGKAKEKNISVDEMINLDALYIYETEYATPQAEAEIENIFSQIPNQPKWIIEIKRKAKEKNISYQEMAELDVKYIYDTEIKNKKQ